MSPQKKVVFTKMSGTGNDFIVIDNRQHLFSENHSAFFARICQRRTSVGADGALLVDTNDNQSLKMRYFNSDGKEAAMCGNGARCVAYFGFQKGLVSNHRFTLFSTEGQHDVEINGKNVSLKMSQPYDFQTDLKILTESEFDEGGLLNTDVPHYVLFTSDIKDVDVTPLGAKYRSHEKFPNGVNVNFIQPLGENRISVRTYERGVEDETLSCGTGSVASALIASKRFGYTSSILVETKGGKLTVQFDENWEDVYLIGEVEIVFEGVLELPYDCIP